jgi:hypothetical protein
MKAKAFINQRILAAVLTIAALAVGQSVWATTKTVTYKITDVSQNSNRTAYDIVFTRSGDTPFDTSEPTTYTASVPSSSIGQTTGGSGNFSVELADGFKLSLSWGLGSDVSFTNNCIRPCTSNKSITYTVSCPNAYYYVTHVMMTGSESDYQSGMPQSYPNTNIRIDTDYDSEWNFSENYYSAFSFGQITVTYTDVPTLSIFESAGENAYKIQDKHDLRHLANYVNNGKQPCTGLTFRQTQDITCDDTYVPIGYYVSSSDKAQFRGTYDGGGFTVSGITVSRTGNSGADDCVGLFGHVNYNSSTDYGTVKNVVLANSTFTGYDEVGGIVGYNKGGTVQNCRVESTVTINAGAYHAIYHGGIVGENSNFSAKVIGCYSAATVSANGKNNCQDYGGIVGYNFGGTVKDCLYAGTTVTADNKKGAIVGYSGGNNPTYSNNYYTAIALGGVGAEGGSSDQDGARRARTVTLGENIALVGNETAYNLSGLTAIGTGNCALSYNDGTTTTLYSGEGQTLTLSYTGDVPDGYTACFAVNDNPIEDNTFQMPASNVTITTALRSTGNSVTVTFVNEDGQTYNTNAIALDGTENSLSGDIYYYYVGTDINYSNSIEFNDVAFLILGDGCTMTVNTDFDAIRAYKNLYIYGQALGTGKLNANGGSYGIYDSGALYIIGGNVTINGGNCGIYADNLKLGWTNASDHIYANSYNIGTPNITINYGHPLTDADGNHYDIFVSAEEINGKHLYPYIEKLDLTANLADGNYWTTFYCGHTGYKINANENACAYTAEYDNTDPNAPQLTLHKLGKVIPKGNAVILVGDDDEISMTASDKTATVPTNNLQGEDVRTSLDDIKTARSITDGTFYVMGKVGDNFGFFKYTGDYMPARKAFLFVDGGAALAKELNMVFEEEDADGIGSLTPALSEGEGAIYNLAGQRLNTMQKGINIVNGKKVLK